jgi:hypothetical protein
MLYLFLHLMGDAPMHNLTISRVEQWFRTWQPIGRPVEADTERWRSSFRHE